MDLSKLPKLSNTQNHSPTPDIAPAEPQTAPSPAQATPYQPYRPGERRPGVGVDIWISLVIGLLLLMLGANFGKWAIATIRHQPFPTGFSWEDDTPKAGQPKEYFDLAGYTALSEMGIFLFGAMLLAEAAAKFLLLVKPGKLAWAFLLFATLLTLVATLLNLYALYKTFMFGQPQIINGLALALGGWILFDEITTLQRTKPMPH
jgi:hypothetical protein